MPITVSAFGKYPDGRDVHLYTISNKKGMQVAVANVGAAIVRVIVPDKEGNMADVALGFDRAEDYLGNPSFFGAVVGPNAIRIAGAGFCLDGITYKLDANDGANNLHSHREHGWHKRYWEARREGENGVVFSLEEEAGALGFPGNRKAEGAYSLDEDNALKIHYHASGDERTILNLTNHSYFNLEGHDGGSVEGHELWLGASRYTPADAGSIPTGEVVPVAGTPMDFTVSKRIGKDIDADYARLKSAGGFDHNWVIDGWDGTLRHFATLKAPAAGRVMEAFTTLPGVQFYAGNFIDRQAGKDGALYGPRAGLSLETQYFPDAPNKPCFPCTVFGGEREYDSVTVYQFGIC